MCTLTESGALLSARPFPAASGLSGRQNGYVKSDASTFTPDALSVLSELNLLRNVEANNQESGAAAKSSSLLSSFRSSSSYNHETETIFALPRMQLDFKSIHVQDPDEPSLTGQ